MGKARSDKTNNDKPNKDKEKRTPNGKVSKHERKDRKSKKVERLNYTAKSEISDDESLKVGLRSPEQAQEIALALRLHPRSLQRNGGASLSEEHPGSGTPEGSQNDVTKEHRNKRANFGERSLNILMEKGLDPSLNATNIGVKAEQKASKQKDERSNENRTWIQSQEREIAEYVKEQAVGVDFPMSGEDFISVEPATLGPLSEDEDMEDGGAPLVEGRRGYTSPPSGMNRMLRRRLMVIKRQKELIQKKLGVPVGSDEKAEEVKKLLDKWTATFDEKSERREAKKKDRKAKDAARVRSKKAKRLAGRQPEEKKTFSKRDRQDDRQAMFSHNK